MIGYLRSGLLTAACIIFGAMWVAQPVFSSHQAWSISIIQVSMGLVMLHGCYYVAVWRDQLGTGEVLTAIMGAGGIGFLFASTLNFNPSIIPVSNMEYAHMGAQCLTFACHGIFRTREITQEVKHGYRYTCLASSGT